MIATHLIMLALVSMIEKRSELFGCKILSGQ